MQKVVFRACIKDTVCCRVKCTLRTVEVYVRIDHMRRELVILLILIPTICLGLGIIQAITAFHSETGEAERVTGHVTGPGMVQENDDGLSGQEDDGRLSDLEVQSSTWILMEQNSMLGDYYTYPDIGRVYRAYIDGDNCIHLVYSDDTGASWNETFVSDTVSPDGKVFVCFTDENTGYLLYCSDPGMGQMDKILYRTEDGGNTFSVQEDITSVVAGYPADLLFASDGTGYITAKYHGTDEYFYRYDGQGGWSAVTVEIPIETYSYINGAEITLAESGYRLMLEIVTTAGSEYYYYSSTDGVNWTLGR